MEWAIGLAMATINDDLLFSNCISDGDNDDSPTLFHEIAHQQVLQNGYWTLQAALSFWPPGIPRKFGTRDLHLLLGVSKYVSDRLRYF